VTRFRGIADEGTRYLAASALALAIDFGAYAGLIRLAGVYYLVAAPIGFALGLGVIYLLSVSWVFRHRRLASARVEFAVFALIGGAGMGLNQLMIYLSVELLHGSFEIAKLVSAGTVFFFNFACRKLLLFTRK
jgi:putative flippase GtrA